jgi:diguanylate cyclase (GGDEF)-like protein/PAS domain S-box-containing protein
MTEQQPDRHNAVSAPNSSTGVFRVVLVYAIFGAVWILLSEKALELLFKTHDQLALASLIKGWFFIAVTSLLLYELVRRLVGKIIAASERERKVQAQKLQALQLLNAIAESSTDIIYAKDKDSRYLLCNREAARLIGRAREEVLGHTDREWFTPEQAELAIANDRQVMAGNKTISFKENYDTVNGRRSYLSTKGPLLDEAGQVVGLFGITRDITEQQYAEELLRERELSYRRLTEQVPAIIYRAALDKYSQITYISPRVETLGYAADEWTQNPDMWEKLLHPEDRPGVLQKLAESHRSNTPFSAEYRLRTKSGEWRHFSDEAQQIYDDHGRPLYLQGVMLDITERKQSEANVHRLAYYDSLTGLPNRILLMDRLGQILTLSRREKRMCALIFLNIDRLKTLNDALGHAAGDLLLKAVAERLAGILREDDTLARMTGDEFAILLQGLDTAAHTANRHAHIVVEKIHQALKQPFSNGHEEVTVTVSLGVTLFPELEHDAADSVLRRADTALHRAKKGGGNQTAFFETNMEEIASQRFTVERELRHALKADELRLYLQSQVDADGKEVGAEALVRWQHPTRGLTLPGAFVPIAEESDLIIELDSWMMKAVCRLLAQQEISNTAIRIAVNISPRHFRQPGFVESLRNLLALTGADPSHLTLEVTEGHMIENMSDVVAKMTELAVLGIHFSVDDFGTGYSSLAYLKRLPIHELKIDKTFVQDAPDDPGDAALVEVILSVASHLKLKIVAEGVETQAQADFLNARAKVIHQGYLFFKPEPVEAWLQRRPTAQAR